MSEHQDGADEVLDSSTLVRDFLMQAGVTQRLALPGVQPIVRAMAQRRRR